MNRTMSAREWTLLLALSILWGGSFFFVEVALEGVPPLTLVLGRTAIAAVALFAAARASGARLPASPRTWAALMVMGAINGAVPYSLIVWAQVHIDSGVASVLNATTPFFTVVLAHVLTSDERITANRLAGVALGFLGVIALSGKEAIAGFGVAGLGHLAVLAAAVSYACAGVYGRRFKGISPIVAAAGQVAGSAIIVLPAAIAIDRPWTLSPGFGVWAAILGIALLSTALAYVIYFRVLAAAGATNVLLVTFLVPVSAMALGILALGETATWTTFAGAGLILTGIVAVDGRLWFRRRPRRPRVQAAK